MRLVAIALLSIAVTALGAYAVPEGFKVRRNVLDYGAKGDGVTDDTAAFIAAMTEGKATISRPGPWNNSQYNCQTLLPSFVFVPNGTYLLSATIPLTFYSQLVGQYHDRPVLKFTGAKYTCLDAGIDEGPGNGWYGNVNQNNFYHQLRNVVVDAKSCDGCTGVHWQVSQATNIVNVEIQNSYHGIGLYMEDGSGGYLGDLRIVGGSKGMAIGNQQFTFRNVSIEDAYIGIDAVWNWIFTFVNVRFVRTHYGLLTGSGVGTVNFIDGQATDVHQVFGVYGHATQIYIENMQMTRVNTSLSTLYETIYAPFSNWFIGKLSNSTVLDQEMPGLPRQASLVNKADGRYFGMTRPNYDARNVMTLNLTNGSDVTAAFQQALNVAAAAGKAVFVPYGTYLLTDTVHVPKGTRIYGEAWSRLAASGPKFSDVNAPIPVLALGEPGDVGVMQWSDFMFTTVGPVPGAIFVQWNIRGAAPGDCGAWDVHFRIGGADGTRMGSNECSNNTVATFLEPAARNCTGAHTLVHLTPSSGNVYIENMWGWVADHDIDLGQNVNIFSARGFVSEAGYGGVWLYGSAFEHSYAFQYNLAQAAADHFIGHAQTETPYYEPQFALNASTPHTAWMPTDPSFATSVAPSMQHAYALAINQGAGSVFVYGTGFYSFFHDWSTAHCGTLAVPCQDVLVIVNTTTQHTSTTVAPTSAHRYVAIGRNVHAAIEPDVAAGVGSPLGATHFAMLNTHGSRDLLDDFAGSSTMATKQHLASNFPNGFCQTLSRL